MKGVYAPPLRVRVPLVAFAWLMLVPPVLASPPGQAAADQVSQTSYTAFMNNSLYTHTGHNRGVGGAQHNLARDNIRNLMLSYGLTVTLEPVVYSGTTYYNVVGTQTGTVHPTAEYVIGAHYDSVSNPGADDNASGVALVLEAARILTQYDSEYTIRFIAFDREEQGLYGSNAYIDDHAGDDIRGMISCDMVAYDTGTNHALVYGHDTSLPLKNALRAAVTEYGGMTSTDDGWIDASDHAPFDSVGYQAALLIEGEVWDNPYYHTQQDTYEQAGNLNFPYAVKMTRSIVGWLVDQAAVDVPYDGLAFAYPNGLPTYVAPAGGTTLRVVVSGMGSKVPQPGTAVLHYDTGSGWQTVPMTVVAANVYDAVFPADTCGDVLAYYVSAQDTGGLTHQDPYAAPTTTYSATAAYGQLVAFETALDASPGWTTQDQWAFGHPTGGGGEYGSPDPSNGHTGTNVYGYNLSGDYPNGMLSESHLTSTAINCTGTSGTHLRFWRWLGVEEPSYDHAYVRVSNNGTTWTTVWQNTATIADTAWTLVDLDISAVADNRPAVYLRWTMGTTDGGWRYCGWNIDDVQLVSLRCTPPGDGDFDDDGDVDTADFAEFQVCFGAAGSGACAPGDMNGDDSVNLADYALFEASLDGPQ
jgi:hypothetical protein